MKNNNIAKTTKNETKKQLPDISISMGYLLR
ncbi:MAG: 50S ribosomal protein L2, large subunit ribosomal protein L2 [Candidatus Campbellbacteria bacterium GW2011_OD1_34_28]|nr:MAG: 50S ribosomal protein L2, large subunit ribosomal protein L2 [Candidatus Campbellbacteria bacterium GW2011_OD1_34_28]